MKKTRFTETQIGRAFKEGEEDRKTDDICRELQTNKATFYNWKSRYGAMEPTINLYTYNT
ncbi:transposase [Sphingobacterium anhuiense]|uniref:transposase n=1 Tax=Sphingobacterium anhuiense TaxID=493780 RepID=UPI003C2B7474